MQRVMHMTHRLIRSIHPTLGARLDLTLRLHATGQLLDLLFCPPRSMHDDAACSWPPVGRLRAAVERTIERGQQPAAQAGVVGAVSGVEGVQTNVSDDVAWIG